MQLDKTRVVIRERTWLDILDLSLGMLRTRPLVILGILALGVLPFVAINYWIFSLFDRSDLAEEWPAWCWWLMILSMLESPLATAPLTLYLGQSLFVEHPDPRMLARDFLRSLPQLILFQVVLRSLLIVPVVTWFIPFALWPYMNEIILLERNPLMARRPGEISSRRRSSTLHAGLSGDLLVRAVVALGLTVALTTSLWLTFHFVREVLSGQSTLDWWSISLGFPLALWLVIGFFTVVRFLSYLDLRIRREGWEVELNLRAEADRLTRQLA